MPPIAGFTVEYSINGAVFMATPMLPGLAGCHTVQVQYVLSFACGSNPQGIASSGSCGVSNMISVVQFPSAPVLIPPSNTCAEEFLLPNVADLTASGFSTQYSIDGGAYSTSPAIPTLPGCHTIQAQYFLTSACGNTPAGANSTGACGLSNIVFVVIFPTAPLISITTTACATNFSLPTVTAIAGFNVEYSIDGSPFTITPSIPAVGCHTIQVRYSLALTCGTTPQGATGSGLCNGSNIESVVIFPAAPAAPMVSAGCGPFTVTPPVSISGFTIEYSFDDGATWGPNNPPTADNCLGYKIKTRYVTAAPCGSVPAGSASTDSVCMESLSTSGRLIKPHRFYQVCLRMSVSIVSMFHRFLL